MLSVIRKKKHKPLFDGRSMFKPYLQAVAIGIRNHNSFMKAIEEFDNKIMKGIDKRVK